MSVGNFSSASVPSPHKIALICDDSETIERLTPIIRDPGNFLVCIRSGTVAFQQLLRDTFDLAVIDWQLPDTAGVEVLRWMRGNMAVMPAAIIITGQPCADDIAVALGDGADDYIAKFEEAKVIAARLHAVLRRAKPAPMPLAQRLVVHGPYCFDRLRQTVVYDGLTAKLTAKEFALALLFFQNIHRPLSRAYLLQTIWHTTADVHTRTLDMHVSKIRTKLNLQPDNGYRLFTVFGYGYRLDRDDENGVASAPADFPR